LHWLLGCVGLQLGRAGCASSAGSGWVQGLVAHAQGRYESAVQDYTGFLASGDLKYLSANTVEFVVNQLTECYVSLGDWQGLEAWLGTLKQVRKTPSWPSSWASFSLFWLYSHRNAWANLRPLGRPDTCLAAVPWKVRELAPAGAAITIGGALYGEPV
jgi:hypothetical protein